MSTLSIRLPETMERQLLEEARKADKTRSELVRDIVADYLARQERERFIAEIVAAAKAMAEDPEAVSENPALADDFLPLENEALDIAEGQKPGEPGSEQPSEKWWR